jgi:very-short-patch-repair endonuclease
VEIDGATHSSDEEVASDMRHTKFLEDEGCFFMRFTNEMVFESAGGVLEAILATLKELS